MSSKLLEHNDAYTLLSFTLINHRPYSTVVGYYGFIFCHYLLRSPMVGLRWEIWLLLHVIIIVALMTVVGDGNIVQTIFPFSCGWSTNLVTTITVDVMFIIVIIVVDVVLLLVLITNMLYDIWWVGYIVVDKKKYNTTCFSFWIIHIEML